MVELRCTVLLMMVENLGTRGEERRRAGGLVAARRENAQMNPESRRGQEGKGRIGRAAEGAW
jgi:hypothetical protein